MQIILKNTKRESIFSKFIFYFSINHHPNRFNQNIIPTSNSKNSYDYINIHFFLLMVDSVFDRIYYKSKN